VIYLYLNCNKGHTYYYVGIDDASLLDLCLTDSKVKAGLVSQFVKSANTLKGEGVI